MEYNLLLKNRRSIRNFTTQKIDPKILDEILHETCMAPSSSNSQPWRFIIVTDPLIIKKISDDSKKNLLKTINDPNSSIKQYESLLRNQDINVFYNAPCLILIVGQKNDYHFYQDCSLAAAYLMFAATTRGLGTCWIGLGEAIADQELREKIGLPDNYQVGAAIIIGYPKKIPAIGPRNEPKILKSL